MEKTVSLEPRRRQVTPVEVLGKLAVRVVFREGADARLQRGKPRVARRTATGATLLVGQLHLEAD